MQLQALSLRAVIAALFSTYSIGKGYRPGERSLVGIDGAEE